MSSNAMDNRDLKGLEEGKTASDPNQGLPFSIGTIVVVVGLMFALYINAILWWKYEWMQEGSYYAHGIFIPFFVALMIYRDRERLKRLPVHRNMWGIIPILLAIVIVLLAQFADVPVSRSISFVLILFGGSLFVAGKKITKALLFPMLFLLTMIPLVPDQLINPVAFPIQMTSAKMAATVCNLVGFPAFRNGTSIQMERYTCNVELPCSGFKTLVGLMAFSAAFGYLVEAKKWKRWTLFLISPPLAILVNGIRITLIALVGEAFGTEPAHAFHDWSGFIVLILGFMFLFNMARALKCDSFLGIPLQDEPEAKKPESPEAIAKEEDVEFKDEATLKVEKQAAEELRRQENDAKLKAEQEQIRRDFDAQYGPPRKGTLKYVAAGLIPIAILLAIALPAKWSIHPPTATAKAVGPKDVPVTLVGNWNQVGKDTPIDDVVKSATNPLEWLDRDYVLTGKAAMVNLLLSAGNGRKVFHDPHTCFLGTGYFMHDVDIETISTPIGPVTVQVTEAEDPNHNRAYVMFLYVVGGKQLQTTQAVNTALIWQTLLGDGGRPSYFIRFRHRQFGVTPERKKEMMEFIKSIWTEIGPKINAAPTEIKTASR
ncbi:MAG: exosortase [Chthonomonadales bacterium]